MGLVAVLNLKAGHVPSGINGIGGSTAAGNIGYDTNDRLVLTRQFRFNVERGFMRFKITSWITLALLFSAADHLSAAPTALWDATNGTIITSASPTDDFFNPHITNLTKMFTPKVNVARPFEDDSKNTLFGDTQPQGFVHFVEWQTPTAVTISEFALYAVDDHPSFNRSMDGFRLYAWNGTSFQLLFSDTPAHPYVYDDPAHVLLYDRTITPVTSNRFRAEFLQNGTITSAYMGTTTYGPRILELDGLPEPATLAVAAVGMLTLLTRRSPRRRNMSHASAPSSQMPDTSR